MVRPFVRKSFFWYSWGLLLLSGCGDKATGVDMPKPGQAAVLTVSPSNQDVVFLDETAQLRATVRDAAGTEIDGVSPTWTSSDPSVVTVDDNGLVTAVKGGQADVTAKALGLSGKATVRVTGPSDLMFTHADWTGDAIAYTDSGADTMSVAVAGESVAHGLGTRLDLVVGSGAEAREIVVLGNVGGRGTRLAFADGYRGTYVVSEGAFDGRGGASLDSRSRLGHGLVERIRMGEFRQDSFDLYVDQSSDDGSTWSPVWVFHLRRGGNGVVAPTLRSPACSAGAYDDFGFWKGMWNVAVGGNPAGTNHIDPVASMCGVQENWTAVGGSTGISLNMYDSRSGKWTQVWVDDGGLVLELSGGLSAGSMVLEGPRDVAGTVLDRVTWTPNDDGTVRQLWETNTGGAGWVKSFDGTYRRPG